MIRYSKIIEQRKGLVEKKKEDKVGFVFRNARIFEEKAEKTGMKGDAGEWYRKLLSLAKELKSQVINDQPLDIEKIEIQVKVIVNQGLTDSLYNYLVSGHGKKGKDEAGNLIVHSIDLTVFTLKIGMGMGYNETRLLALGMAAFFHDIGMYKIPPHILSKKGRLTDQELAQVKRHPEITADILLQLDKKYNWLADICIQVHERQDGSGYPKGLKNEQIHDFAYIIGLVDIYSAMIKQRPHRDRIEQNRAMRNIIASSKGKFPVNIIKVFLNQISFFPLNSYVRLNDHSIGNVVTTNENFPLKPTVEVLYASNGKRLRENRIIDLSKQPFLYITGSVDEEKLS